MHLSVFVSSLWNGSLALNGLTESYSHIPPEDSQYESEVENLKFESEKSPVRSGGRGRVSTIRSKSSQRAAE